ncbi:MAG: PorT family protein [Muribaculaceae bacterium]|nr:PorT family protein [Muribaculaceae bacterium]
MRKISLFIIAVLALLCGATASAQTETRWGVTAGANYNEIHLKQSDIMPVDKAFGPMVGLTGEMNIQGIGFGVDLSLLYSMRSGKLHYGDYKVWSSLGIGNETVRMHSIDVPLNLKFRWHKMNGFEDKLMPFVAVGPTFSFLVSSNLKDVNHYTPVSVIMHFGAGIELYRHLQLQGGFNFSIGQTLRTQLLDENIAKNRYWTLTATYFFKE